MVAMLWISLRRSVADWPIVLAAGVICLLAATLLAAGSIYAGAVSTAGLHRVLADSPASEANIEVSVRADPAESVAIDAVVSEELRRVMEPPGGVIFRHARSDSFALPDQPAGSVRELAVLGSAEGLADHASLVSGSWPEGAVSITSIPVAVTEAVAAALDLEVGERLPLQSRLDAGFVAPVEIAGIFRIDDPGSTYWWDEALVLDGMVVSEDYVTHGPFFATAFDLSTRAASGQVELTWHAYPTIETLRVTDVGDLSARVTELRDAIHLDGAFTVLTGLPEILERAERSLLVTRTGVLLLTIQLVVLAAYAVLLSAALLIDHRRIDSAMLRSRGAGTARLVGLAGIEALLLTTPAALAGPWLAAVALRAFNVTGPLAEIGLTIEPDVTVDAFVAAGAAAIVCFVALTLPAFRSARSYASTHRKRARGETASIGQRLGLDVALLAVTGVGLWQLRHYGAPLTQSVQGTLGLDPLLVATPAIGLLAGAIVALRIVPLLAQVIERATAGRRSLVPSLGARQLARRPLRYTRAALLLMLAMAMGVFAICYTWTWTVSQRDQAGFQVGADIRVVPGTRRDALPRWALDQGYAAIPGVTGRLPIDREPIRVSRLTGGGQIVALDAEVAASVATLRPDLSAAPLSELLAPLAAARPDLEAVELPGEPRQLRFDVLLDIRALERQELDDVTGTIVQVPADLAEIRDGPGRLELSAVVRDSRGMTYRFGGEAAGFDNRTHLLVVPLGDPGTDPASSFAYPLELLAVEVFVGLPEGYQTPDAALTIGDLAAAGLDGAWQPVSLELAEGWRNTGAFYGRPHQAIGSGTGAELVAATGVPGLVVLPGVDRFGAGVELTFAPSAIGRFGDEAVPVVASAPFLEATSSAIGDEVALTIDGVRRSVVVTGAVRAFPGTAPEDPIVLMDLPTLAMLRFEGNDAVEPAEEWWLSVDSAAREGVVQTLSGSPIGSREVVSAVDRNRALATDPVALGIIGALGIGFVAAALFAVVGFMVSAAVAARERITEFALLRALGLSSRQLSVWLSLENAALAAVSLATGTVLGLVIAWVVLPFITVTQGAATPFPPVEVDVPWTTIAALEVIGLVALAVTVVVLAWLLRRIALTSVLRMSED
jgi:hypothetical protein